MVQLHVDALHLKNAKTRINFVIHTLSMCTYEDTRISFVTEESRLPYYHINFYPKESILSIFS